jgi:hypothetical protein
MSAGQILLTILLVVAALATLYVLVRGVIGLIHGGGGDHEARALRSQELMRKRVMYQAVAIIFAVLLLLVFNTSR